GVATGAPALRPEVAVSIKGPVAAPRRSIDTSALVGWLTLRAVDREAKRLEAEQREIERRVRLNAAIEERLKRLATPAPPAPAQPTASTPAPARMPPPPGAERPRAGIESAPLSILPR